MRRLTQQTNINETHTIESLLEVIKNIIKKTSEEIIGKQGKAKRKPWFNTVLRRSHNKKKRDKINMVNRYNKPSQWNKIYYKKKGSP